MKQAAVVLCFVFLATMAGGAAADYTIDQSVVGSGGGSSSGGSYSVTGTVGQPAIGVTSSAGNVAQLGFWYQPGWILTGVDGDLKPAVYFMRQNCPNPFNPMTALHYSIAEPSHVEILVYDVTGRVVRTLVDEDMEVGPHEVVLRADGLSSGVYFARMVAGKYTETRKMVLLK